MRAKCYKVVYFDDMGYYADKNTVYYDDAKTAFAKAYEALKSGGNLGCYIYPITDDNFRMAKIVIQEDLFNDRKIEVIIHV